MEVLITGRLLQSQVRLKFNIWKLWRKKSWSRLSSLKNKKKLFIKKNQKNQKQ